MDQVASPNFVPGSCRLAPSQQHRGKPNDAFPSGHAVHIGAIAAALTRLDRRLGPAAWGLGSVIASTRVLLLAHWVSDVLAGLALGVLIERGVWGAARALSGMTKYKAS